MARLRKVRKLNVAQRVLSRLKASSVAVELNERYRLLLATIKSIFYAPLTKSITDGNAELNNYTRNSIASLLDFEGVVNIARINEARFVGARRIENITKHIRDYVFNTGGWTTRSEPEPDVIRVVATFAAQNYYKDLEIGGAPVSIPIGGELVYAVDIRKIPGVDVPTTVQLITGNFATYGADFAGDITEEWQRFSSGVATNDTFVDTYECGIKYDALVGQGFEVRNPQLEVVSGQANQNPSEFISVSIGTEAESCQDPSLENEIIVGTDATWIPGTVGAGSVSFTKIPGALQLVCGGVASYSDYTEYADRYDHNKDNGEKIFRENRLYAVSVTIANSYLNTMTGSSILNIYAGYDDTGEQIWQQSQGDGTFTVVRRASSTAPGVGQSSFWLQPVVSGIAGDDFGYDIVDISVKEIDHGSNVDGVYYSDKVNYNTVNSGIVSTLPAPTGAEVQQMVDPTMSVAAAHPLSDNSVDWNNGAGTPYIDGTKLILESGVITSKFLPEALKYYRLQYEVIGANIAFISFGGASTGFPLTIGSHDVILRVNNTTGAVIVGSGTGSAVDNVYITPITRIPDDYLGGVIIEETKTNLFTKSEDLSHANWTSGQLQTPTLSSVPIAELPTWEIKPANTTDINHIVLQSGMTKASLGVVSISGFFRKGTKNWGWLRSVDTSTVTQWFNLETGELGSGSGVLGATITPVKDGYYCTATFQTGSNTTFSGVAGISAADNVSNFVGVIGEVIGNITGLQAEVDVQTSYIATDTATVNRSTDSLSYAMPEALKIKPEAGVVFAEVDFSTGRDFRNDANWHFVVDITDATDANRVRLRTDDNKAFNTLVKDVPLGAANFFHDVSMIPDRNLLAAQWSGSTDNDLRMWLNGTKDTQVFTYTQEPDFTTGQPIYIGSTTTDTWQVDASVKDVEIYVKELTDDTIASNG